MRAWWTGAALLALGLAWMITHRVLATLFPLSWGGPNIGGGLLILLALAVAVAGLLVLALAAPGVRAARPRPSRLRVLIPVALDVVLLLGLVAVRVVLPGDTGPDGGLAGINGQVGVAADAAGAPLLLLEVCHGSVDTLTVVGPNRGSTPNEVFVELQAREPVSAPVQVALLAPPQGWSGAPASLPLDTEDLLIATASGAQSELRQVDFSAADLAELAAAGPEAVQYSVYDPSSEEGLVDRRTTRAGFHELACAGFPDEGSAG